MELDCDDLTADVERLVDMGVRTVAISQGTVPWVVLADSEGNEFCVLSPGPSAV